jgi:hypothetical protein
MAVEGGVRDRVSAGQASGPKLKSFAFQFYFLSLLSVCLSWAACRPSMPMMLSSDIALTLPPGAHFAVKQIALTLGEAQK